MDLSRDRRRFTILETESPVCLFKEPELFAILSFNKPDVILAVGPKPPDVFPPLGFTAGFQMEVALFRAHNTAVTLGQAGETGVTIALVKALFDIARAVNALDHPQEFQCQVLPYQLVHGHQRFPQGQLVLHRFL